MSDMPLLRIATSFVSLELHGPAVPPWGMVRGATEVVPHFALLLDGVSELPSVRCLDPITGSARAWGPGSPGPCLFEQTLYRLRVKAHGDRTPELIHRDPLILTQLDEYADDRTVVGTVNFGSQVGLTKFEVRVADRSLTITLEVYPTKVDYQLDYRELLSDVAATSRGLALEFLRATFRTGATERTRSASELEWLILLRNQLDELVRTIRFIDQHPHRALVREEQLRRVSSVRQGGAAMHLSVIRGRGKGPLIDVPGVGKVHSLFPARRTRESLDTHENRWIKLHLDLVRRRLGELHSAVLDEHEGRKAAGRPVPQRLVTEQRELDAFTTMLDGLLRLELFREVEGAPVPGFTSVALTSATGYGAAYRTLSVLKAGLGVEGEPFQFSVKDVHELYEIWVFLAVARIISSLVSGPPDIRGMAQVERAGIRVRLRRGQYSAIAFQGADRTVTLIYNPEYRGLTGNQRPDVVIRLQHSDWPDLFVILDAKYRLDASPDYVKQFGSPGPAADAVNALHRYRDAIVVDTVGRGIERPVVKGAALFPLAGKDSAGYPSSRLHQSLSVLGIGAIPFLPGNTKYVEAWLASVLQLSVQELSEPGPPFSGLRRLSTEHLQPDG